MPSTTGGICLNKSHIPSQGMGAAKTGRGRAQGFPSFFNSGTFLKGRFSSRVSPGNWLCPLLLMHCNSVSSSASCMFSQVLFLRVPLNKPQACIPLSQSLFPMSPTYGSVTFKQQHLSSGHISNIIHRLIQNYHHHQFLHYPPTLH